MCTFSPLGVQVIFEGIRGQSYKGDTAIDDIQFTVGSCPVLPANAKPTDPWTTPAVSTVQPSSGPTTGKLRQFHIATITQGL